MAARGTQERGRSSSSDTTASREHIRHKRHTLTTSSKGESEPKKPRIGDHGSQIPRNTSKKAPILPLNDKYTSTIPLLQIEELLMTTKSNLEKRVLKIDNTIRKLQAIIERIPNGSAKSVVGAIREQSSFKTHIPFPNPQPKEDAKYTLIYSKPKDVSVVGSYVRRTAIPGRKNMQIDLAITMPSHIFQGKDYLNYRYFYKRAYYLACLASGIKAADESSFTIEFAKQDDNDLKPILIVTPCRQGENLAIVNYQIRVILAAEDDLFPTSKTLPNQNALRLAAGVNAQEKSPTPFYNASIRSECLSRSYLELLKAASSHSNAFKDACILGNVWIRQRDLSRGGFGSFEWASTMALLMYGEGIEGRTLLSTGYSSYQSFKAVIHFLAARDLVASPFITQSTVGMGNLSSKCPVLFDGARGLNILYKMKPWSYELLRYEALCTSKLLSDPVSDHFSACFITLVNEPSFRFDYSISMPINSVQFSENPKIDAISESVTFCDKLYHVLKTGFGDRTQLIHLESPLESTWPLESQKPDRRTNGPVRIGLLLNPEHVNRTVDRGPLVEDKKATAVFRKFWGDKAELRRFKEGAIQESLLWSVSNTKDSVLKQIFIYLVQRHFGQEVTKGLMFIGEASENNVAMDSSADTYSVTQYQPIMSAFQVFEAHIRALRGFPLKVRQILAADPQLRYTSVKVPVLHPTQSAFDPVGVLVQFEGSSGWPDSLPAIQQIKIAFLLKISDLLTESISGLTARVGLENEKSHILNIGFLDIIYPSGAVFRLRVYHDCELSLLERAMKNEVSSLGRREDTASALSTFKRSFVQAPILTQAVQTLCTRFPLLSPSIRLLKRWRDSHFLLDHVSDELIEILTIRTFVHPYPWSAPGSEMTGLLRTIAFISKWDWRFEPLIVDLNGELTIQDMNAINLRFEAWRKIDPAMNRVAMFAATNMDREGTTWTETLTGPPKMIAARFTSLAKAAHKLASEQSIDLRLEALFAHSMKDYDFLLYLNTNIMGIGHQTEKDKPIPFKNLQKQDAKDNAFVGYRPVQSYLAELRSLYDNHVFFCHGGLQGSVIGGLWNPQSTGPRPFKINLLYSTAPAVDCREADHVEMNKNAILHEICRLGGDMVLKAVRK